MATYIGRRILFIIPTVFIASILIFLLIHLLPGDVIAMMVQGQPGDIEAIISHIRNELGLDKPLHIQYIQWLRKIVFHRDFGTSLWRETSVLEEIGNKWSITFELGILALIISQIFSIPLGVYSAVHQDKCGDYFVRSFAQFAISVPNFWLGSMVIIFSSIWWNYSPSITFVRFSQNPIVNLKIIILPAIILGISISGLTLRMVRNVMLEELRKDYIRTAFAKGLKKRSVFLKHALKNALIPVLTIVGNQVPIIIGGSVVVEEIFGIPGMGRLIINSIFERDYPLVSGAMVFFGIGIVLSNLIVDLIVAYLDPKITLKLK